MKTNILIGVLVIAMLVSGCCSSPGTDNQGQQTGGGGTGGGQGTGGDTGGGGQSLSDRITDIGSMFQGGDSYRCTYVKDNIRVESLIKGQKFSTKAETPEAVVYSISDGTWVYSWQEGQPNGIKIKISDLQQQNQGSNTQVDTSNMDVRKALEAASNLDCRIANVPDSSFTPASGINFVDMQEQLRLIQHQQQQLQQGQGQQGQGDSCSVCDMIPDQEAKQQCLQNC